MSNRKAKAPKDTDPQFFFDLEQGTEKWLELRRGLPTASAFASILARGKDGKRDGRMRTTLLHKLAGEIITGELSENYTNQHMERGKEMEAEVRSWYAFLEACDLKPVGFVKRFVPGAGWCGCSPDSIVDNSHKRLAEFKTHMPHYLIPMIEAKRADPKWFPPEHKAQCQGNLLVSGYDEIDVVCYWPKMPKFIQRAERDEPYLRELADEIGMFNLELKNLVDRLKGG